MLLSGSVNAKNVLFPIIAYLNISFKFVWAHRKNTVPIVNRVYSLSAQKSTS